MDGVRDPVLARRRDSVTSCLIPDADQIFLSEGERTLFWGLRGRESLKLKTQNKKYVDPEAIPLCYCISYSRLKKNP